MKIFNNKSIKFQTLDSVILNNSRSQQEEQTLQIDDYNYLQQVLKTAKTVNKLRLSPQIHDKNLSQNNSTYNSAAVQRQECTMLYCVQYDPEHSSINQLMWEPQLKGKPSQHVCMYNYHYNTISKMTVQVYMNQ